MSRPAKVAPWDCRWYSSFVSVTARPLPPAIATAGASRPLSGPTSTPSPSATSTAIALRALPTPGSTTARITPLGTYEMHRARARLPARTSNGRDLMGQIDQVGVRGDVADHGLDDPGELVDQAVVGQQRDGVVAAAHRRQPSHGSRRAASSTCARKSTRADANPPMAPALSAHPCGCDSV